MKNIFVEKMRHVMSAYYELQKMTNEKMEENRSRFSPEYAKKYNQELIDKKGQDYLDAKSEITRIYDRVRDLLARASFPASDEMTADAQLFTNPYVKLTKEEIEAMAVQYRDNGNFTMLRMVSNWCEENEKHDMNLYLPKDQILAYKKLAESAMFTINGIYGEQKNHFIDLEIEHFADPIMCRNELETIGDGECLKKFDGKVVPEMVLHTFDSYALKDNSLTPVHTQFINSDVPAGSHYNDYSDSTRSDAL